MIQFFTNKAILFALYCFAKVTSTTLECNHQESPSILDVDSINKVGQDHNACSIYLSPSSVPGGGMGIFSAKDFRAGEVILYSDGPNIPIIDPYHSPGAKKNWALFESYWWGEHSSLSPEMRFEAQNIADYQITFGALPNFHTYLYNLGFFFPEKTYESITEIDSPARGAYSYHRGRVFYALRDITAGEEIFLNYGETYLDYRSYLNHVPRYKDFVLAGNILYDLVESQANISSYDFSMMKKSLSHFNERLASLLPNNSEEFLKIHDSAMQRMPKVNTFQEALSFGVAQHKSVVQRSLDDSRGNGFCLDNIVPRPSTITHAGNGAFAKRFITKGTVIVPVPLLHMVDGRNFVYNKLHYDNKGSLIEQTDQQHTQLLLNYCFGHHESTLLMCPTTNAVLLNHNAIPNAVVRWADWDTTTNRWKSLSLKDIQNEPGRGLSLDIVAIRDIEEGEEIFIDYGREWERSWHDHLERWQSRPKLDELSKVENSFPVFPLTHTEKNIFTGCIYIDEAVKVEVNEPRYDWRTLDDETIIKHFGINWQDMSFPDDRYNSSLSVWPCTILAVDSLTKHYTVRIFQHHHFPTTIWEQKDIPRILTNFPRSSIKYFHKPYNSDVHMIEAFRHFISISDDIFPPSWKNRCIQDRTTHYERKFSVSEKVNVNWAQSGEWHPAVVSRWCQNDLYEITYDDGDIELNVEEHLIRRRENSIIRSMTHPYY